jgi:hypothetical protein
MYIVLCSRDGTKRKSEGEEPEYNRKKKKKNLPREGGKKKNTFEEKGKETGEKMNKNEDETNVIY